MINEAEPKFQSVHTRSSFNQTFGGWYANYVPLSTKFMQSIIGNTRVSVFHIGAAELKSDIQQVGRIVGKKSSLSTFTAVDKGEKLAKGQGIQTKGGVIYQIEGTLLVASTRDIQSTPDKTGRRWVPPYSLAGKVAGGKMYDELKKGIKANKLDRDTWNSIERKAEHKWEKEVDYYSDNYKGSYEEKEEALKKIMGPLKRKWIKKYIDMCYKIMRKYKKQIKRHILSQKDKGSEHGWNEIVVNQIHIQDVFLLKRVGQYSSIRDEVEKIAKGTVTVGSPAQFRKWYQKRDGIINEAKRIPRKKGQHRNSPSHSDLYTDENPKGTIKGLKFATVKDAQKSVSKIKNSGKSHAHKIQAAVAMEQRAKEMGKSSQAAVYRAFINKMKKKTKKKNEMFIGLPAGVIPSPSRKAVKKNKTDSMSGYKKVNEKKWSDKYKKSIDCNNPKGFSQKAHCDGKKKKESKDYTFGPDWIPTSLAQRKKMKRIHQKLNRSIREDINIPIKIGDTILTGRFKNKKTVVKSIDKDEHGMPTINGRKVVTFRIPVKESSQVTNAKGVKGYSAFVELGFENEYYKHLENIFTKNGETMILKEGIKDPGILKAVFLAGGPGSGKTWVAKGLFGIPDKVNVSQTGMKMVNTDKELKFLLKKYGFGTDLDALPDELFRQLTDDDYEDYSGLRGYAKELTGVRKKLYQNGRLGLIIDGTGDDYAKISKEKKELEEKGYDCYMIFVNTTLDVALERNRNRDRVLPEKIVVDSHRQVIKNIGGFQGLFGGNNFLIIDNNKDLTEEQAQKRFNMLVKKGISKFVKKPIQNPRGKSWVRKQKMLETYTSENGTTLLLERVDFRQIAKELMRRYRVHSKLEFSSRATKGDYDFDRDIIKLRPFYSNIRDFLITVLHEIYHAMDSKKYGKNKFVAMYTQAGQEQEDKGKDFHDDNPFEIAAERWARREVNKYIKKYK